MSIDASPNLPLVSSNFDRETNGSLGSLNSKDMVPGLVGPPPVGDGGDGGGDTSGETMSLWQVSRKRIDESCFSKEN